MFVTHTTAEPPSSNDTNYQYNAILTDTVIKVNEGTRCSLNYALVWVQTAKNTLPNVHGNSPNQLMFGKNPNFRFVLHNNCFSKIRSSSRQLEYIYLCLSGLYAETNQKT